MVDKERIAVAMSGGVDSSVTAALLQQDGYEVFGMTMLLCDPPGGGEPTHVRDAAMVAKQLGIVHHVIDFREQFRQVVVGGFVDEYFRGRTPNPCARCNRAIKFGLMLEKARELGADRMATGHYARLMRDDAGVPHLLKGSDPAKDQSYFLFDVSREQLAGALFPLGGMRKTEVRELAQSFALKTAEKSDSQEICFIPDDNYVRLLEEERGGGLLSGNIVTALGEILGRHQGTYRYTIGQRRGLGIAWSEPLYVLGIDAERREVVVGTKDQLSRPGLVAADVNWIVPPQSRELQVECKIRYRHAPVKCSVTCLEGGRIEVVFAEPQNGVTPGQAVVFYQGEELLGGGWIEK
jgi:tRNA-specific 2-thiouridylase